MLHGVMRAPMSFFEQTPTGRILNLFSRDVYVVDAVLARVRSDASNNGPTPDRLARRSFKTLSVLSVWLVSFCGSLDSASRSS